MDLDNHLTVQGLVFQGIELCTFQGFVAIFRNVGFKTGYKNAINRIKDETLVSLISSFKQFLYNWHKGKPLLWRLHVVIRRYNEVY
jgi:hypothetical protein